MERTLPSESGTTTSRIAVAVVEHEGRFLIGRRPAGVPLAGMWEFPGGKVEPGETPVQAAARECKEETGMSIEVGEEYPTVLHEYQHGRVELHFFACKPCDPRDPPRPPFQWASRAELATIPFPPANADLIALLTHLSDSD